jgi:hypothetical protein
MNQVLNLLRVALASSDPGTRLYSDHMLSELLHLHEEMIAQLCVERLEATSNTEFLTDIIAQHEATAAMLRSHLEHRASLMPFVVSPVVPGTFPPLPVSDTFSENRFYPRD